ncbi:MFS transporter [Amycolatopsis balhimycina]|uniref:MFS transporter n=1 Tax=Amycolatopsis balhimycina TaxID=208443 RepID=UPI000365C1DB|nr:MFS transporter [Amycolatopsis balhimycina]
MSATTPLSTTSARWDGRLWAILLTVSVIVGLDALDVSMVGVALPAIRADLGMSTSALQWVAGGYALGFGGLLLLGGRTADLLGRRRVFLAAVTVFIIASFLGGIVDDGALLIATRFIKGVAAAFTLPAALSIITTTFQEGPARWRALGIYAVFAASGFAAGLVFSGLLTQAGWRWTFFLPVPIALVALLVSARVVPGHRPERGGIGYDLPGAITGAAGSLLLVFTIVQAPEAGFGAPRTVLGFAGAVALLVAFVLIERRSRSPLLRLGILRSRSLATANLGIALFFGAYLGFQFVVMLYLQSVLGWSPLQTALGFLPSAVFVAFGSPKIGPLIFKVGTERMIFGGLLAHVLAYALFLRVDEHSGYWAAVFPSMVLLGIGFLMAFASFNIQATAGVADHEQGLAGGLLNTSLQVGGAIGLAVVAAVLTASGGTGGGAASLIDGFVPAISIPIGLAGLGVLVVLPGTFRRRGGVAAVPADPPATELDEAA